MAAGDEHRRAIVQAREVRNELAKVREAATAELVSATVGARRAGLSMTEIARLAGFSRMGLYKLWQKHEVGVVKPDRVNVG